MYKNDLFVNSDLHYTIIQIRCTSTYIPNRQKHKKYICICYIKGRRRIWRQVDDVAGVASDRRLPITTFDKMQLEV